MTMPAELVDPFTIVANALGRPRAAITIDSAIYRDHGWDSFGHMSVLLSLQKAYGIAIDDSEADEYTSMRAILELHERLRSGGNA